MVSPRRVERLCSLIKQRVAEVLMQEAKDPRLGFVTITRVELDRRTRTLPRLLVGLWR